MAVKKRKRAKAVKEFIIKNKVIIIISAAVFFILFIFSGTKLALYLHLVTGNDIVVILDADKKELNLVHGNKTDIIFEAKAKTNPFCSAMCSYAFIDISANKTVDSDDFELNPADPLSKKYTLRPPDIGEGTRIFRFDMKCVSKSTFFCHTKQEPSTRSILVILDYGLNEEEKIIKQSLKQRLGILEGSLNQFKKELIFLEKSYNFINISLATDSRISAAKKNFDAANDQIEYLDKEWANQDYNSILSNIGKAEDIFKKTGIFLEEINNSLYANVSSYNKHIDELLTARQDLKEIQEHSLNNSVIEDINNITGYFNIKLDLFKKRGELAEKEIIVNVISQKISELKENVQAVSKAEVLKQQLKTDIAYETLCKISAECIEGPSIEKRAVQEDFDTGKACGKQESDIGFFKEINNSMQEEFLKQNYSGTEEFWSNISSKLGNMKRDIISQYLINLPPNESNTLLIKQLITEPPYVLTEDYDEYNITPALIFKLTESVEQQNFSCNADINFSEISQLPINKISLNITVEEPLLIFFKEPEPQCCIFGKCSGCCLDEECKNDPLSFPVIFIHGHAIDKDVSAEYSLEGFNEIQERLEKDGYLNAGTVTLYSEVDSSKDAWKSIKSPLTIRASYYFDVFKQPENYILVQTKSENIDAYSLRLNELVNAVKYKTGRPKVNIVAFSMGGLVARRYAQIFGSESISKLILIGTPNNGIVGDIADYCPITGEKLECKDMNSESLFINKLNRDSLPNIPVHNIIATGCDMEGGKGDGTVLEEKAFLEGARNYIINGTCQSKIKPMHLAMRDISKYPEIYDIIKEALLS